jgi:uncharacterized membrane protein
MGKNAASAFKNEASKGRLEFLFDGVFAIAMTILVLELKLPELQDKRSVHELGQALLHHGRTFIGYIISFIILSAFWIGHNRVYAGLTRITRTVMAIHVWLLAVSAFIPFCAHLIGRYPGNPLALMVYIGTALAYVLGMLTLVIVAGKQKLFDPAIPPGDVKRLSRGFIRAAVGLIFIFLYYLFVQPVWK